MALKELDGSCGSTLMHERLSKSEMIAQTPAVGQRRLGLGVAGEKRPEPTGCGQSKRFVQRMEN
jgi:hypothetical protein